MTSIKEWKIVSKINQRTLKVANHTEICYLKTSPENVRKYKLEDTLMLINPMPIARGIIKENPKYPLQRRSTSIVIAEDTMKNLERDFNPAPEDEAKPTGWDFEDGQTVESLQAFLTGVVPKVNKNGTPFRCLHVRSESGQKGVIFDYSMNSQEADQMIGAGISLTKLYVVKKGDSSFRTTRASKMTKCPGSYPQVTDKTLVSAKLVAFTGSDQSRMNLIFETDPAAGELTTISFRSINFGNSESEIILQTEAKIGKIYDVDFDESDRAKYGVRMTEK